MDLVEIAVAATNDLLVLTICFSRPTVSQSVSTPTPTPTHQSVAVVPVGSQIPPVLREHRRCRAVPPRAALKTNQLLAAAQLDGETCSMTLHLKRADLVVVIVTAREIVSVAVAKTHQAAAADATNVANATAAAMSAVDLNERTRTENAIPNPVTPSVEAPARVRNYDAETAETAKTERQKPVENPFLAFPMPPIKKVARVRSQPWVPNRRRLHHHRLPRLPQTINHADGARVVIELTAPTTEIASASAEVTVAAIETTTARVAAAQAIASADVPTPRKPVMEVDETPV